ncbi:MAG: UTRA domain-containing protein [Pseudomonadota bacterium]
MATSSIHSWRSIEGELRRRIQSRVWQPGQLIPNESDLAEEFGCARATVNRALRFLAEQGLVDRKRRAGTRVTLHPVRKATLHIPIVRQEIEDRNQEYGYALISSKLEVPPSDARGRMKHPGGDKFLKTEALHLADGKPYLFEDRWINVKAIPEIGKVDLSQISANEWLVANAPLTTGVIAFSAMNATGKVADVLKVAINTALFVVERTTWDNDVPITDVKMIYADGYRMRTVL